MGAVKITETISKQIQELRLKGEGYRAIALTLGLSRDAVRYHCRSLNLDGFVVELNAASDSEAVCDYCLKPVKQPKTGRKRKYCSEVCRREWWKANQETVVRNERALYTFVCACCGKPFTVYGNKDRRYCSHGCYIQQRFKRS